MTKEEIINSAKVIVLPDLRLGDTKCPHNSFKTFRKKKQSIELNNYTPNDVYNCTDPVSKVFFQPRWIYDNVISALKVLCPDIRYEMRDVNTTTKPDVRNLINNDVIVELPVQSYPLAIQSIFAQIRNEGQMSLNVQVEYKNINEIVHCYECVNENVLPELKNDYNRAFRYSHGLGVIINQRAETRKTILVNGGEELNFIVPVLTQYYGKVIFLNNRFAKSDYHFSATDILGVENEPNIDEIVFIMNPNEDLTKYTEDNLM